MSNSIKNKPPNTSEQDEAHIFQHNDECRSDFLFWEQHDYPPGQTYNRSRRETSVVFLLLDTEVNNRRSVFAHGKTTAQKYNKFLIKQSFKIRSQKKTFNNKRFLCRRPDDQ